jgi:hypothetical protein
MYLDVLEKSGIKNLDQKINVKTKFPDGHIMTDTFKAGHHFIEHVFFSEETQKELEKLDDTFLKNCKCKDKEELLEHLKYVIQEVGSEDLNIKSWLDATKNFNSCDSL